MSRGFGGLLLGGLALLNCAGCAFMDPYERVGMWRPRDSNEGNLSAMVADPHDLQVGRSDHSVDAVLATQAVDRLRRNQAKPLPSTDFEVGGSSTSSAGAAPADSGVY